MVLCTCVTLLLPILASWLSYYCFKLHFNRTPIIPKENLFATNDYIIVGAGTAGSAVAARLSELENVTVLVLEAGPDDLDFAFTQWLPMEWTLWMTDFDWKYETVAHDKCGEGSKNKKTKWPRGKGLGGSSAHNGGNHARGSRYDYEMWDATLGPGSDWSFEEVLHYFKKMETVQNIAKLAGRNSVHGFDGPIVLGESVDNAFGEAIGEALTKFGYAWRDDMNALGGKDEQEGYTKYQRSERHGRRMSTSQVYLRPALARRPNHLHVLTHAHVTKILFALSNTKRKPIASGVQFIHKGEKMRAGARREVIIISAGAVGSPHTLMLSGIGPKEELEKHGIPILVPNDAVGRNLYDHPLVPVSATVNDSSILYARFDPNDWWRLTWAKIQFHLFGTGPLCDTVFNYAGLFRSGLTDEPWPEFLILPTMDAVHRPGPTGTYNEKAGSVLFPTNEQDKRVCFVIVLLHPHNPGEIRLQSADPFDHPIIDPKYLHSDLDVNILAKGVETIVF